MQEHEFIKIGQYWPEQGGIFAGLMRGENEAPDYYLVLATEKASDLQWGELGKKIEGADSKFDGLVNTQALIQHDCPAAKWAASVTADGHTDFYLPAPHELSLLYANVSKHIDLDWHWSSTQYSAFSAWVQHFGDGRQYLYYTHDELAVRAVRRVYPLSDSTI